MNKTRWLQRAWWRYLQARWGYSANIHSWELTNEGDPALVKHWEMSDELGKYMHCEAFGMGVGAGDGQKCTYEHPNRHLVTTSFWHSFPLYDGSTGAGFWGNPKYPNLDYADIHAYISTSPAPDADKILMERDAAYYHLWHSREWGARKPGFPLVRGEAGMVPYKGSTDDYQGLGIERDIEGVWYHNYLWSTLDGGGLYEIYWYANTHIYKAGAYDHRAIALQVDRFLQGIPLNNGFYVDAGAQVSTPDFRVVGQKDLTHRNAHLWIQNKSHTWRNIVDGAGVTPVSGILAMSGFKPGESYQLEWWDTYAMQNVILSKQNIIADGSGNLRIVVDRLERDVALKIRPMVMVIRPEPPTRLQIK
jgi:hypothetical protein